jgi:pimeloyl-ACP methyl ester carboxylesterase
MRRLRVNDYDMAYIEVGQGRPLVCVHGSIGDFRTWSSVLGPLSRAHRVIAVSLRHFFPEQWDGVGGRYTIAQHVSDVIAFVEALEAGPVDLMGHSRGGHIAFRVAQQRTELVRRLVLAEPGGELDGSLQQAPPQAGSVPSRNSRVAAAAEKIAAGDIDGALQQFIDNMGGAEAWARLSASTKQEYRDNARTLIGQVNEQRAPFTRADAEAIRAPTLFIGGADTPGTLPLLLRAHASAERGSQTGDRSNAPHPTSRQAPGRTPAAVLEFLA